MSTKIEWTEETWNPVVGCSPASHGCDRCYAASVAHRAMQSAHVGLTVKPAGEPVRFNGTIRLLPERLGEPLRWRKPRRVFVGSMTDLFHPDVPEEFLIDVFAVMAVAEHHTFQVLTKRPRRMATLIASSGGVAVGDVSFESHVDYMMGTFGGLRCVPAWPLPNVWLGTSIESDRYTWRANHLRDTPAAVRFLSLEPLLGPLPSLDLTGIDWVIVGCESGPGARPMDLGWVRDIRDRCTEAAVPLFVKQLSSGGPRAIHDLDEFPPDLRIREYPT